MQFRKALVGAALLGATAAGGAFAASALVDDTTPTTPVETSTEQVVAVDDSGPRGGGDRDRDPSKGGHQANGVTEELLTGDTAASVTAAAQAALPGATIERVETDADGAAYEAHVVKADGTHATITFNADFTVVAIEDGR